MRVSHNPFVLPLPASTTAQPAPPAQQCLTLVQATDEQLEEVTSAAALTAANKR